MGIITFGQSGPGSNGNEAVLLPYIYIYILKCISVVSVVIMYPDELLRRNCSRLVPDSQNNL